MRLLVLPLILAGCTLSKSGGGDGDGKDPLPPDDARPPSMDGGDRGPLGRQFTADRATVGQTACPTFFEETSSHQLAVAMNAVTVDGRPAFSALTRDVPASELDGDPPNVTFSINELWDGPEGSASPQIDYRLWTDAGAGTGQASTSFPFTTAGSSTTCSFEWTVSVR